MAGATVAFTNTTTGAVDHFLWDFGDGGTNSLNPNPVYFYAADGLYTVTLTVYGVYGGMSVAQQLLEIDTVADIVYDYV